MRASQGQARRLESVDYPAISAHALLAGLESLGLERARLVETTAALQGDLTELDRRLPKASWSGLFAAARDRLRAKQLVDGAAQPSLRRAKSELELMALQAGLRIPLGAFGTVDYLVGSAATVGAGVDTLAAHFTALGAGFHLTAETRGDGGCTIRVVDDSSDEDFDNDDFTLGSLIGRFSALSGPEFRAERIVFRRRPTYPEDFRRVAGVACDFGGARARLELSPEAVAMDMARKDAVLHHTLRQLASQLHLGSPATDLELAIRCRLRDRLQSCRADATSVPPIAQALGVSERTLHRRLASRGLTFRGVVDTFRVEESERLLLAGTKTQAEIAGALGYADESTWARAFRRWRGCSPGAWLSQTSA